MVQEDRRKIEGHLINADEVPSQSEKKQMNLGSFEAALINRVQLRCERVVIDIRELTGGKVNSGEFMMDVLDTSIAAFGEFFSLWLKTPLGRKAAWKEAGIQAKVGVGTGKIMADMNELLRAFFEDMERIVKDTVREFLEKLIRETQSVQS